ncbi:MAG: Shedu immune nuclease family protein [Candidatus Nanopelagicales bacterium]
MQPPAASSSAETTSPQTAPEAPLPWDVYETWLTAEWSALLSSEPDEPAVQEFLTHNPSLLPGVGVDGAGHHGPHLSAVFSQPQLQGIGKNRTPDFMWVTANSAEVVPVLIEIERPDKRYFNSSDGSVSAEFRHAHGQLAEWAQWWAEPANQLVFRQQFLDPIWNFSNRAIKPLYILIYGRRSELDADKTGNLNKFRAAQPRQNELIMTFDRLEPNPLIRNVASVHQHSDGRLSLLAVPSSFTTGWGISHMAVRCSQPEAGLFETVPLWTSERAARVRDRWRYWSEEGAAAGPRIGVDQFGE